MKKLFLSLLCALFCIANLSAQIASGATGSCTWEITGASGNYTLTISGPGAMGSYNFPPAGPDTRPWLSYANEITAVVIGDGVAEVTAHAFRNLPNLSSVDLGGGITAVRASAFANNPNLASVTIPNTVHTIGGQAFQNCAGLTTVTIGTGVAQIVNEAFAGTALTTVTILATTPPNLGTAGLGVFFPPGANLYVPNSALATYQANVAWAAFFPPGSIFDIEGTALAAAKAAFELALQTVADLVSDANIVPSNRQAIMLAIGQTMMWMTANPNPTIAQYESQTAILQALIDAAEMLDMTALNLLIDEANALPGNPIGAAVVAANMVKATATTQAQVDAAEAALLAALNAYKLDQARIALNEKVQEAAALVSDPNIIKNSAYTQLQLAVVPAAQLAANPSATLAQLVAETTKLTNLIAAVLILDLSDINALIAEANALTGNPLGSAVSAAHLAIINATVQGDIDATAATLRAAIDAYIADLAAAKDALMALIDEAEAVYMATPMAYKNTPEWLALVAAQNDGIAAWEGNDLAAINTEITNLTNAIATFEAWLEAQILAAAADALRAAIAAAKAIVDIPNTDQPWIHWGSHPNRLNQMMDRGIACFGGDVNNAPTCNVADMDALTQAINDRLGLMEYAADRPIFMSKRFEYDAAVNAAVAANPAFVPFQTVYNSARSPFVTAMSDPTTVQAITDALAGLEAAYAAFLASVAQWELDQAEAELRGLIAQGRAHTNTPNVDLEYIGTNHLWTPLNNAENYLNNNTTYTLATLESHIQILTDLLANVIHVPERPDFFRLRTEYGNDVVAQVAANPAFAPFQAIYNSAVGALVGQVNGAATAQDIYDAIDALQTAYDNFLAAVAEWEFNKALADLRDAITRGRAITSIPNTEVEFVGVNHLFTACFQGEQCFEGNNPANAPRATTTTAIMIARTLAIEEAIDNLIPAPERPEFFRLLAEYGAAVTAKYNENPTAFEGFRNTYIQTIGASGLNLTGRVNGASSVQDILDAIDDLNAAFAAFNLSVARAELQALVDNLYTWWWQMGYYPGAELDLRPYPGLTNNMPYHPYPVGYSEPVTFMYRAPIDAMAAERLAAIALLGGTPTLQQLQDALTDLEAAYEDLKDAIRDYLTTSPAIHIDLAGGMRNGTTPIDNVYRLWSDFTDWNAFRGFVLNSAPVFANHGNISNNGFPLFMWNVKTEYFDGTVTTGSRDFHLTSILDFNNVYRITLTAVYNDVSQWDVVLLEGGARLDGSIGILTSNIAVIPANPALRWGNVRGELDDVAAATTAQWYEPYKVIGWIVTDAPVANHIGRTLDQLAASNQSIGKDYKFEAIWESKTYSLALLGEGGIFASTSTGVVDWIQVEWHELIDQYMEEPNRSGYDFDGWLLNSTLVTIDATTMYATLASMDNGAGSTHIALRAQWSQTNERLALQQLVDNLWAWWWIHGTYPGAAINLNDYPNITNAMPYYPYAVGNTDFAVDDYTEYIYREYIDAMVAERLAAIAVLTDPSAVTQDFIDAYDVLLAAYEDLKDAVLNYAARMALIAAHKMVVDYYNGNVPHPIFNYPHPYYLIYGTEHYPVYEVPMYEARDFALALINNPAATVAEMDVAREDLIAKWDAYIAKLEELMNAGTSFDDLVAQIVDLLKDVDPTFIPMFIEAFMPQLTTDPEFKAAFDAALAFLGLPPLPFTAPSPFMPLSGPGDPIWDLAFALRNFMEGMLQDMIDELGSFWWGTPHVAGLTQPVCVNTNMAYWPYAVGNTDYAANDYSEYIYREPIDVMDASRNIGIAMIAALTPLPATIPILQAEMIALQTQLLGLGVTYDDLKDAIDDYLVELQSDRLPLQTLVNNLHAWWWIGSTYDGINLGDFNCLVATEFTSEMPFYDGDKYQPVIDAFADAHTAAKTLLENVCIDATDLADALTALEDAYADLRVAVLAYVAELQGADRLALQTLVDNLHAWWWIHGTYPGAELNLNDFNCLTLPADVFTDAMPLHNGGHYIPVIDAMDDARNDAIALLANVCINPTDLTDALTALQGAYGDLKDAIKEYVAELQGADRLALQTLVDNLHAWWWIHGTYPGAEINLNDYICLVGGPITDAMPLHDGGHYIPVIDAMDDARNDAIALLANVCINPTDLTDALTALQGAYDDLKDAIKEYVAELQGADRLALQTLVDNLHAWWWIHGTYPGAEINLNDYICLVGGPITDAMPLHDGGHYIPVIDAMDDARNDAIALLEDVCIDANDLTDALTALQDAYADLKDAIKEYVAELQGADRLALQTLVDNLHAWWWIHGTYPGAEINLNDYYCLNNGPLTDAMVIYDGGKYQQVVDDMDDARNDAIALLENVCIDATELSDALTALEDAYATLKVEILAYVAEVQNEDPNRLALQTLVDNLHAWWWIHGTYPGAEINLNNFNCLTTPLPFTDAMPLHDGGYYIPVIDAMDDARNDAIALLENVCIDPTDLTAALTELQGAYADLKDAILEYVAELRGTPEFNFSFRDVADRTTPVPNRDLAENEEFIVRYDLSNNEGLCDLYTTITVAVTGPTGADITFDLISSSTGAFIADLMIDRHEIGSGQLNSAMPGGMIAGAFQKFSADLAGDYKIVYTLWDVKTHTGAPGGYPSSTATVLAMDSVILTVVDTATFTITIAGNLEFHASPALIATMPSGQAYLNSAVDAEIARLDIQPMIINIKGNNDGAVGRNDVRIIKTDGIHYNLQLWANDGTNWYDLSRAGWLPNGNEFAVTPDHDEDIEVFVISNMTGSYPSAYDLYSALGGVLDAATDTIVVYNYRVTFNSNGGSFVPEQHLNNGDKVAKPADPIRTGYTFDGWYTDDEDFTNAWDFATYVITSDTTLYAKWETDSFDIHYTLLGGTNHIDNPAKYTTECPNITLEPATRKGYTFINWYPSNSIPTGSTGDKWFTASWSIINYNITYVLNGGTNNPNNPATYTIESPTITLQDPTRPGYDFVSWTPSSTIPAGDTGHVTFTANWSAPITYNITYVLDGGTNHTSNPANYTVESATITLQDPIRTGHTFTGWTPSNNIPAGSTGDRTFTANWDVHIHVVAFESQGGTAVAPQNVAHGQKVVRPTDPTRLGYTFDGWFKEAGCVNVWDFAVDVVTTATTLYAKWNTITYNISFVMNGGTYTGTQPTTYTVESSLITLTTPTRPGYTFTGWTPNNNIPAGSTGDRTFTANWSAAINYNITYVLNGGTNHAGNPATYTVESPTITLQAPTREGYNFVNWTPSSTITAGSTGNLTFTANWSAAINYNITYVLNGGTNHASNPLTYNVATPTITLQDPTRTGYTFTGWTPSNTIPTGSTGDRTFTAHWNINTYTVTFNSQGGSPVTSQTINYGGTVAVPATPTLMGHIFDGWYREAAGVNAWNFATDVVTSNLTLYAKWTADDKHTVIVVANNGNLGTASGGATDVIEGTQLTLTAAPRTGFVLINWTIDGVVVSTDESFIYTVTSAITTTITANFGMLFEDYVVMRWGSTFMLNITAKTGVGITTVNSCQWYLGSTLLTTTYGPNYGYTAGSAANTLQPNGQYRYVIQTNMGEIPSTIFQGYTPQKSTPLTGYPNPIFSGERLTVEGVTEGSQIEVYNQRGVRVISTKATGTQTTININLPAGQYLLRTENGTMNVIVNK